MSKRQLNTMFGDGARVLITGASSGLGAEMARRLGAAGARLALTARRADRLAEVAAEVRAAGAVEVLELQGGVEDRETVRAHHEAITRAWGVVDVAILNAGVACGFDGLRTYEAEAVERSMLVNVVGVANWIECVLPAMRAAETGVIAGISSPAGWFGVPTAGPYAASKAALSTLLAALRVELRYSGISVIEVCPGFVRSEMTATNDPRDMVFLLETDVGARRILEGIARRRRLVHFPRRLTVPLRLVSRLVPAFVLDLMLARFAARTRRRSPI